MSGARVKASIGRVAKRLWASAFALPLAMIVTSAVAAQAPFDIPEADLPVALLVDASSGQVLYARNPQLRFAPASITKVMTLYTAFDWMKAQSIGPNEMVEVDREIWEEWRGKGSRMFLNAGDRVPLADLVTGIANVSANDASAVLAKRAGGSVPQWINRMNRAAQRLGMRQSRFGTPNGWPDEGRTFTTAQDLTILARALIADHPQNFRRFIGRPGFTYAGITQVNHDPLLGRVEGADGIKTGYTNDAGFGFLGTAKRGDQRLITVTAGAQRKRYRDKAAHALIEWGFSQFEQVSLFSDGETIGTARVQNGAAREIKLVADSPVVMNVPKGADPDIEMTIVYEGPLRAPIQTGETLARLEVTVAGMEPTRIPLRAQSSVAKAGFFDRIINAFAGWFS